MSNFIPGDVIEFEYPPHYDLRRVVVEKVESHDGRVLVGGHDQSVSDDEHHNYRQFYVDKMRDAHVLSERKEVVPNEDDQKNKAKVLLEALSDFFGLPKYPTNLKEQVLYDINALESFIVNLPAGNSTLEADFNLALRVVAILKHKVSQLN